MVSQTANIFLLAALGFVLQISALPLTAVPDETADKEIIVKKEGETIELPCEASGTYSPSFHWLFNNVYQQQGPLDNMAKNVMSPPVLHTTTKVKTIFRIEHALPEHSGKYTCVADSITHRVTKSFTVKVESSDVKLTETDELSPARIYEWVTDLYVVEGNPMYVTCRATQGITKPVPTIVWTIGGKHITESDNIKIHSNGDLELKEATPDFHFWAGNLTCHAINDDGNVVDQRNTFVYVYEKESDSTEGDS